MAGWHWRGLGPLDSLCFVIVNSTGHGGRGVFFNEELLDSIVMTGQPTPPLMYPSEIPY